MGSLLDVSALEPLMCLKYFNTVKIMWCELNSPCLSSSLGRNAIFFLKNFKPGLKGSLLWTLNWNQTSLAKEALLVCLFNSRMPFPCAQLRSANGHCQG